MFYTSLYVKRSTLFNTSFQEQVESQRYHQRNPVKRRAIHTLATPSFRRVKTHLSTQDLHPPELWYWIQLHAASQNTLQRHARKGL